MSMLAEKKIKQKWVVHPKHNNWSQDSNKLGQKILEKMGWSTGKGLGAQENGIIEHIRIPYKHDNKGMGYNAKDNEWTEHEKHFTSLLETLSSANETPVSKSTLNDKTNDSPIVSLEEKSRKSKARVHYKKFTRGKDLSKYSAKDLANIFGKKSIAVSNSDNIQYNDADVNKTDDTNKQNDSSNFSIGGSMTDYFKTKLSNLGNKLNKGGEKENVELSTFDSDIENRPAFGFGFENSEHGIVDNTSFSRTEKIIDVVNGKSSKKKSKKKRSLEDINTVDDMSTPKKKRKEDVHIDTPINKREEKNTFDAIQANDELQCKVEKKKKKKSKKDTLQTNSETGTNSGIINPGFNPLGRTTPIKLKKHVLDTIEEKENEEDESLDKVQTDNGKGKQSVIIHEDIQFKNGKIHFVKTNGKITFNKDDEIPTKTKSEKKKKKKSEKKEKGLDNPLFMMDIDDENNDPEEHNGIDDKIKKKKSKKKSKKSKEARGIDNPGLNLDNTITEEQFDIQLNVVNSEPIINEHDNNDVIKLDQQFSVKRVKKMKRKKSVKFNDVTQEIIIPNGDNEMDLQPEEKSISNCDGGGASVSKSKKRSGLDNQGYDERVNKIEENVNMISNRLESIQAQVENDINEKKINSINVNDLMVGEIGNSNGNNEKLSDGTVKMKFKYAQFANYPMPPYMEQFTGPKKCYKHLIKGDIVLNFIDTNLHEVHGYTTNRLKL